MKEEVNFKVRFFARKSRGRKTGNYILLVRVTVNSKRVEISLKKEVPIDLWDEKMQCLKGRSQSASRFNSYLDKIKMRFNLIEQQLLFENKKPTAELVKARYNGDPDPDEETIPTLLELYDEHNRRFQELIGTRNHSESTYKRHLTSRTHVAAFVLDHFNQEDIEWKLVNPNFLNEYEHWLKLKKGCNHNSSMKYIVNFGKVIRLAYAEGYLDRNPLERFKITLEKVVRNVLSESEIEKIIELDLNGRLDKVRDCFVFSIYSGLPFVDLEHLTTIDIYEDKKGNQWINKNRYKTEVDFLTPVLPVARELIEKYNDDPVRLTKNSVLPVPSNQKYNAYLKEIADLAGINKVLTTHLARHTFATTVTLNNGVPIEVVSKMLVHSSVKTTQIYAKVREKAIELSMGKMMKKKKKDKKKNKKNKKNGKGGQA